MITHTQAQDVMLAAMGLDRRPSHAAKKEDVLASIRRMGVLQIDTIHVVARSPYFVLWSRLGAYDPAWLDDLLAEGKLFEYWAHAACFIPVEDYGLFRRLMLDTPREARYDWLDSHADVTADVMMYIREHGEAKSAHFKRQKGQSNGWWDWKAEKMALEMLFGIGELMIARRENFHRVYALPESVLPDWDDAAAPPLEDVYRQFILNTVKALGITTAAWVADYYRTKKNPTVKRVEALAAEGLLQPVVVEGWAETAYIHPDNAHLLDVHIRPELTTLLSPFDPLIWDRERLSAMFDFDYRIECYTPEPKRIYGYFSLPILWRGELVGRLDAKAHRKEGRFEVKVLHLEPDAPLTDELAADIAGALRDCAVWHGTPEVEVVRCNPPQFQPMLVAALRGE